MLSFLYKQKEKKFDFEIKESLKNNIDNYCMSKVSPDLSLNRQYVNQRFSLPSNGDIIVRDVSFYLADELKNAFLVCVDGLTNGEMINQAILKPLMLHKDKNEKEHADIEYISNHLIPHAQVSLSDDMENLVSTVNIGNAIMFIDGFDKALIFDVKSWEHRGVSSPSAEEVIQGPHEGFNEVLRCNTALIRKTLNNPDLVMENISLGKTSKTPGSIAYIKNIANDSLVDEVKRRINSLDAEYILSSLDVEQYIEEASFLPIPQIVTTERPDRVCKALVEGRVAVVLNGSSHVLVMPATIFDLASSVEDEYLRFPYSVLIRIVRIAAILISLLTPAVYVAITQYHQDMILKDLFLSIQSSRLSVPFPIIFELLIMELSFELIREAGVRVPGHIGSTLGIVGGLILGTAAVDANIGSPIMIIVVAITGIASFAIPSYSLSFSLRFSRFIYILFAALGGFLGLFSAFFAITIMYMGTKSFGVPYGSPVAPYKKQKGISAFFRKPIWMQEERPQYLRPKSKKSKPPVTRKWLY